MVVKKKSVIDLTNKTLFVRETVQPNKLSAKQISNQRINANKPQLSRQREKPVSFRCVAPPLRSGARNLPAPDYTKGAEL